MTWWQKVLCVIGNHKPVETTFLRMPLTRCAWCGRAL